MLVLFEDGSAHTYTRWTRWTYTADNQHVSDKRYRNLELISPSEERTSKRTSLRSGWRHIEFPPQQTCDPCIRCSPFLRARKTPRMISSMAVPHKHDPIVLVIDFHHAR